MKKIKELLRAIKLVLKYGEEGILKDPLTGFYNRLITNDLMNRELIKSERYNNPFSIILLDTDKLKEINDTKGHLEGDKAISKIASVIKKNIRKTDIACRWGGDEFLLLLVNTSKEKAEILIKRIKEQSIFQFSYGISQWEKGMNIEEIIKIADAEMYKDKNKKS